MKIRSHRGLAATVLSLVLLSASCVDAPSAPEDFQGTAPFLIAPVFSLVAPSGPPVSPTQASALSEAFDRVDHFRMIVSQVGGGVVLDTLVTVTPGADQYDLQVDIPASAGQSFLVTLVALEGTTELFKAESIPVQATPPGAGGGTPPPAVDIPLTYSGPGATAVAVEVAPGQTVLGPGGTAQMGAKVLDDQGAVIADAPVAWSSTAAGVATISASGLVTGVGDGVAEVVATSPTGLTARAWVYVVSGTLAYVQDGVLKVRAPAGGEAQAQSSGGGASGPTWAGNDLYYSEGGSIRKAGSSTNLLAGSWPSVSPGGGKIAADAGGTLVFANIDGSNPTEGPAGTTPIWTDWATLVVGGGSIQQVDADGTSRSTLVSGEASLPALSNDGGLAWVSGGKLMVQGRADPLADVGGRPTWSPDGAWIVAPGGGGLLLVPTSGPAPPVVLPGLAGASDPAWQGTSGGGGAPPGLNLTGLSPDPAIPGQETAIEGTGFDVVIPANNKVFWPGPDGAIPGEVLSVTRTAIRSVLPRNAVAGQIRVENRQGSAVLGYEPSVGSLEVHAQTPWGTPVAGVGIRLVDATGTDVASGATDGDGVFTAEALVPGGYTVHFGAPSGFSLDGDASRSVSISAAVAFLDVTLTPSVASVKLTPERPTVGVLDEVGVRVEPFDINGDLIPEVRSVSWASGSSKLDVWESDGLGTTLVGRKPSEKVGDAGFSVTINGRGFGFGATVTGAIAGTITNGSDEQPAQGTAVLLRQDGENIARTTTDNGGRYQFGGLLAGTYVVRPAAPSGGSVSPSETSVTLNDAHPRGEADFTLYTYVGGAAGDVIVVGDINYWGSSSSYLESENNKEMTRNFVTNGARTKTVWYQGHNSYNKSQYSAFGYFSNTVSYIQGLGQTVVSVTTGSTGSLSIPDDAGSFWIWMPQDVFDAADIAEINRYLAGGGRVILIGENNAFPGPNARVQQIMNSLGSSAVYHPACYTGAASDVNAGDPLMADVSAIYTRCTSYMTVGSGDVPLVSQNGNPVVLRLSLGAPVGGPPMNLVTSPALKVPGEAGDAPVADPSLGPGSTRGGPGGSVR